MQETSLAQAKSKKKHRKVKDLEKHGGSSKNENNQKTCFLMRTVGRARMAQVEFMMTFLFHGRASEKTGSRKPRSSKKKNYN